MNKVERGRKRTAVGILLAIGPGGFIDGIILHQILEVRYVRQVLNYTLYNLTFLAVGGVLFILFGRTLMRAGNRGGKL